LRVLVVNAGSSSVKLRLLDGEDTLVGDCDLDAPQSHVDPAELLTAVQGWEPDVVGHRVVHGGTRFREAVLIDAHVRRALEELTDLAPLHQPGSLAGVDAVSRALPEVPAVACFDTAFHSTLPDAASTYALPRALRERFEVRRYGFHGLSHAYASRRAVELTGGSVSRVVTCHLGAGASLCAVLDGRSVDTTMGFTPLEGLVMATRSGNVDPGLLLWLLERDRMTERELAEALEHSSGLLGLADTADMREVLARDDDEARLALDVYIHRLRAGIASMVASLGGLDVLVFTGGVGENAPEVRDRAVEGLAFLGISAERVLVIPAREDLEIARQVRALLNA
jgi:acetate kinase